MITSVRATPLYFSVHLPWLWRGLDPGLEGKKTQEDDDGSADGEPWVGWVCGGCVKFGQSDQSMRAPYSSFGCLPLASPPLLLRRVLALTSHPTQHTHTDRPRKQVKEDGKELGEGSGVVQVLSEGPTHCFFTSSSMAAQSGFFPS